MDKPLVHLFKTRGANYLFDTNRNAILQIDDSVYKFIEETLNGSITIDQACKACTKLVAIINAGFLSNNRVKEICHKDNNTIEYILSRKLFSVALQVTQQCNLRCKYCVYSGNYNNRNHSDKKMSSEIAKKSIDFLLEHSIDSKLIAIGFYGGEPLLEYELIKECIYYAEEKAEGKDIIFTLTTNATLLNDNIIKFFIQHNVNLVISLDGPAKIHDTNRRFAHNGLGTFSSVMKNINQIKEEHPQYISNITINAVIDQQNDFSCTSNFFTNSEAIEDFFTSSSTIANNYITDNIKYNDDFNIKIKYEYFKLLLSKLGKLDERSISKLMKDYYYGTKRVYENLKLSDGLKEKMHPSGPCTPGTTRLFVNVDGYMFPCERVSEESEVMKIGHIDRGFDIDKVKKLLNVGRITEGKCKNCWAFRLCNLCASSADGLSELSSELRSSHCESVRRNVEKNLKDICTLKEKGMNFDSDIVSIS